MNMIEKILARASGRKQVTPGEVVIANVNLMVMHDLSANFVMRVFREELGGGSILDPSRIAFVFDHNFSPATEEAARTLHKVRRFAAEHGISQFVRWGQRQPASCDHREWFMGSGQVIIGCDSHTPIYGALGVFATGVGNNSMAALGFQHGKAWFRVPSTMQVYVHGTAADGVDPRDVAQYVVGHLGEDSAIYRAIEYGGPYIKDLSIEDRKLFPLMSIDLGAKASFVNSR
jgi:3-isopropylmalate/(R)-2-methylmalate dehydratase large subunit